MITKREECKIVSYKEDKNKAKYKNSKMYGVGQKSVEYWLEARFSRFNGIIFVGFVIYDLGIKKRKPPKTFF